MSEAPNWGEPIYRKALLNRARYLHIDPRVQVRFDMDDLVSETLLRAVEASKGSFPWRGTTEGERFKYLFAIQSSVLADLRDAHIGAGKRSVLKEQDLRAFKQALTESMDGFINLAAVQTSVSEKAIHNEELEWLEEALARLPERERLVVTLRRQGQTLEQIAKATGDTVNAVGSLYTRGAARLSQMRLENSTKRISDGTSN